MTFSIWQKKNADGKTSGVYDWTSLMGHEVKLLLTNLPDKLQDVLKPETSKIVTQIWKVGTYEIMFTYNNFKLTTK